VFLTELPLPISLTHNGDDAPQNSNTKHTLRHSLLLPSPAPIPNYY